MRIFEVTGDSEDIVFDKLKKILVIYKTYYNFDNPSSNMKDIFYRARQQLTEDSLNLLFWVQKSQRISNIYFEISKFR